MAENATGLLCGFGMVVVLQYPETATVSRSRTGFGTQKLGTNGLWNLISKRGNVLYFITDCFWELFLNFLARKTMEYCREIFISLQPVV